MRFPETTSGLPPLGIYKYLLPAKDRYLGRLYAGYLKLLLKRGLQQKGRHPQSFNLLYRAVSHEWPEKNLLGKLQKEFIDRNLSLSLLLEPLDGAEWMSKKLYPLEVSSASPIWLQIILPVARFTAVLNNQKPPFYQPFANLAFGYAQLYLLSSQEAAAMLRKVRVSVDELRLKQNQSMLYRETKQIMSTVSGFSFRLKIGFYVGLLGKLQQRKNAKHINFLIYVNAFLYGLMYTLTIKSKIKGLEHL